MRWVALILVLAGCAPTAPAVDVREVLTREALDQSPTPLLLVEITSSGAQATMVPWVTGTDVTTWRSGDGISLSLRDGLLVATRGLRDDLMSADLSGTLAALGRGAGTAYPVARSHLDTQNRTLVTVASCDLRPQGPDPVESFGLVRPTLRYAETCSSAEGGFTNIYWSDADGVIWKSRQWAGKSLGSLVIEHLVR